MLPKLGKDVISKKDRGILRTKKEREIYEEAKRRKAEEEEEEERKRRKKLKALKTRMPEHREPTAEELAEQQAEVIAGTRKFRIKKVVLKEEE